MSNEPSWTAVISALSIGLVVGQAIGIALGWFTGRAFGKLEAIIERIEKAEESKTP